MSLSQEQYVLEHWKFNADQRLKTFNFFVAFSIFANGGVFTAFDHHVHPIVLVLLGGFVIILSCVFAVVDARCRALLRMSRLGMAGFEAALPQACRMFEIDHVKRHALFRFTVAFNALFALQWLFGAGVVMYALCEWTGGFNLHGH